MLPFVLCALHNICYVFYIISDDNFIIAFDEPGMIKLIQLRRRFFIYNKDPYNWSRILGSKVRWDFSFDLILMFKEETRENRTITPEDAEQLIASIT